MIKSNFSEDRYLSAAEVRPGNRAVVHHVIVFVDSAPNYNGVYTSERLEARTHDGGTGAFGR